MTADIFKANGYALLSSGAGGAGVKRAGGFALLTGGGAGGAGVIDASGYQVLTGPPTVNKAQGYIAMAQGGGVKKVLGYLVYVPLFPEITRFDVDFEFMEEQFPECISFGSSGGPGFSTNVVEFDSGYVAVNKEWDRLRARYVATLDTATPAEIKQVEDFFYIAKGRAIGFRFKDWQDYQIVSQNIGVGDGVSNAFQAFKRYISGTRHYDRKITKLRRVSSDGNDMSITLDGVAQVVDTDVFVNESLGFITFLNPPPSGAVVRIEYGEFDVPVRFDTDELDISFDEFRQLSLNVPLIEILV